MATSMVRTQSIVLVPLKFTSNFSENPQSISFSSRQRNRRSLHWKISNFPDKKSFLRFLPLVANGEATETKQAEVIETQEKFKEEISDEEKSVDTTSTQSSEEKTSSAMIKALQSYKVAVANDDNSKLLEIETFFQSLEDEKKALEDKVNALSEELSSEKDRVLRISADFDNFRKRTERERLSLVSNVQGEVIESLLPVLDNFERAEAQIKIETEGEEKINNSYQSISKQFNEIMSSLGVVTVETVGTPFDPLLHEAIMREDSTEYEEDIIIEEFRKGFKLGDRLLRPSMVKVSAGPGPANPPEPASSVDAESSDKFTVEGEP